MKLVHLLTLGALAMPLLPTSSAHAYWDTSYYRCTFDQLGSSSAAKQRRQWAQHYAGTDPYNLSASKDWRFWDSSYTGETSEASAAGLELYPVYYNPATNSAYNMPDDIVYAPPTVTTHTVKPKDVFMDGICAPGCYDGGGMLLMGEEELPIQQAFEENVKTVTTLTPSSTFDRLELMDNRVGGYISDYVSAEQKMIRFTTSSGIELRVTENHPIVAEDGAMREARDFQVGDAFITAEGDLEPIVVAEPYEWFGRTYNLKPKTRDLRSNILVAEGLLNGSLRYQNELADELNRVILRSSFPETYLPQP